MTHRQIELKQNKATIRAFMKEHYTDERLTELLAHAQDGKLDFMSCCCFIGIVTANHPLRGISAAGLNDRFSHYGSARLLTGAPEAEAAFNRLWLCCPNGENGDVRRRALIPIVKAEIRRRDRAKQSGDIARSLISEMELA